MTYLSAVQPQSCSAATQHKIQNSFQILGKHALLSCQLINFADSSRGPVSGSYCVANFRGGGDRPARLNCIRFKAPLPEGNGRLATNPS